LFVLLFGYLLLVMFCSVGYWLLIIGIIICY